jgi:hypothetical protein
MKKTILVFISLLALTMFSCNDGNSKKDDETLTDDPVKDEDVQVNDESADQIDISDNNEVTDYIDETNDFEENDDILLDDNEFLEDEDEIYPDNEPDVDIGPDEDVAECSPAGTLECPIVIKSFPYIDERNTNDALSDEFDSYPPNSVNESGPEYIYSLKVTKEQYYYFSIRRPEPDGVDVDLHLVKAESPYELVKRDDKSFFMKLEPGEYLFIIDTYESDANAGEYVLSINHEHPVFNDYVLAAVDYLYDEYRLLGYDSAVLTHDITYGEYGIIPMTGDAKTMCVAAVMEVILTAFNIYADDTGDNSVYDTLPIRSWKYLGEFDLKAHIWVNYDLNAGGTADALRNFNMGGNIPFEELKPGSFVNVNRTTGTGHAVDFLSFIDINGDEYTEYNENIIGFRYFSSQGGYNIGDGGLDYRYAVFDEFGSPEMPYKRDTKIIYSQDQHLLNTGVMFMPQYWSPATDYRLYKPVDSSYIPVTRFNPFYFNGWTIDDIKD